MELKVGPVDDNNFCAHRKRDKTNFIPLQTRREIYDHVLSAHSVNASLEMHLIFDSFFVTVTLCGTPKFIFGNEIIS